MKPEEYIPNRVAELVKTGMDAGKAYTQAYAEWYKIYVLNNKMPKRTPKALEKLIDAIDKTNQEIEESKILAQQIKDQAVIDAEAQKQEILEEVRKQAEDEKAVILKDLRNLRYKVSKAVKDGRK